MSDPSQNPAKRIKSTTNTSMPTSPPQTPSHPSGFVQSSPFSNPYQSAYTNNPTAFAYPQQGYVPHQQLPQPIHQPLQPPLHLNQPSALSPPTSRKRRASEIDDSSMTTGSSLGSSLSAYMPQQGMMTAGGSSGFMSGPPHSKENVGLGIQGGEMASPAPKKGRTNTPWTPGEEMRLKQMRDAGNSWAEIAKTFPNRTEGSVKKHWYKDMHYAEFADDEGSFSQTLAAAIKDYEANKWKAIGQKVGKPAKACEQYAKEHLNKT